MPKPGPRTTHKYSDRFKATAVRLSQLRGVSVQEVAESLYIHPFMLSRWRKQAREGQTIPFKYGVRQRHVPQIIKLRNTSMYCVICYLTASRTSLMISSVDAPGP